MREQSIRSSPGCPSRSPPRYEAWDDHPSFLHTEQRGPCKSSYTSHIYSFLPAGGTIVQFINFVGGAITFCNVSVTQKFGLCTQTLPPSSPFFGEVARDETTLAVAAREQTGLYFMGHLSSLVSFTPPYISEPHHLKLYY